jgi:aspartyl-tRNA(Asn)/glutamyl-tRNA(Gln) amidotransferase subunit B
VKRTLPELPDARRRRFMAQYALPEYDASLLTQSHALAAYFEATAAAAGNAKAASNWIMGDVTRKMNEQGVRIEQVPLTPEALAGLIRLVDSGTISGPTAKEVFEKMFATGRPAQAIVEAEGLARIDDEGAVQAAVSKVLAAHSDAVKQYRAGKKQTYGFLVGQVIKSMGGKANPELVNKLVRRELDKDPT